MQRKMTNGFLSEMAENSRRNARILREQQAPSPGAEIMGGSDADEEGVSPEAPPEDAEQEETPEGDPQEAPEENPEEVEGDAGPEPEEQNVQDPFADAIVGYIKLLESSSTEKQELVDYIEGIDQTKLGESAAARAFIDQNLSSLSLLDETVVVEIRKQLRRSNSADEIVQTLEEMLDRYPEMADATQRLVAAGPDKSNLFRQLVAALCGGAVVPSSVGGEVHIPRKKNEEEPLVVLRPICTLNWGYIDCGPVSLTSFSPEEYLTDAERTKLVNGAPEERRVLRNRVFVESVADQLGGGTFIILAVSQREPKWELASFTSDIFRESYESGELEIIESAPGPNGDLAVGDGGEWVTIVPWQMAIIGEEVQLAPDTQEVRKHKQTVAQMFGNRFVWVGTGQDIAALGGDTGERVLKSAEEEKIKEIRRSVPDARERLLGRR